MGFDWDVWKAARNQSMHGVSFDEAASVFDDPLGDERPDLRHPDGGLRWRTIGLSNLDRIIVVTFTVRGDTIRLISARRATKRERHDDEG